MTNNNQLSPTQKWRIEISERLQKLEIQIGNHLNEHKLLSGRLFALLFVMLSGIVGIFIRIMIR